MEEVVVWLLRIAHILAGAIWVGAAYTFFLFVRPSVAQLGPGAGPFMRTLLVRQRFSTVLFVAPLVTVAAGALLYWRASGGLHASWIGSPTGLGFTIGAVAAIAAFVIGGVIVKPAADRMLELGGRIAAAGGPPSAQDATALAALNARLTQTGYANLVLVTLATVMMAVARYLG